MDKEQPLQEWFNENRADENLYYAKGLDHQVTFVRDTLPSVLCNSYEEFKEARWMVVSYHMSKSVKLPVYQIRMPGGLCLTMRYNFYDWKVSVASPVLLEIDPERLFTPDETISPCYLEGFPDDLCYGSYLDDPSCFTVEVYNNYKLYCFLLLLTRSLRAQKEAVE